MFRLQLRTGLTVVTAYLPTKNDLPTLSMSTAFSGLTSYQAISAEATYETAGVGAASTIRLTFKGSGVADLTHDITIAAGVKTGIVTVNRALTLSQYQTVEVQAWNDTEPSEPPTGLSVMLNAQYPPVTTAITTEGLYEMADVLAAKPPNSPIVQSDYWDGMLRIAESKVKAICRRKLQQDNYMDKGYTLSAENPDGEMVYVWYLREPTGTALAFTNLTAFTLNDDTVDSGDVTIEVGRLIFNSPGEVKVTYPGGYLTDTTHKAIILQVVIAAMHEAHRASQAAVAPNFSLIEDMLGPYRATLMGNGYAEGPD
jgi:hypothetical protein